MERRRKTDVKNCYRRHASLELLLASLVGEELREELGLLKRFKLSIRRILKCIINIKAYSSLKHFCPLTIDEIKGHSNMQTSTTWNPGTILKQ